MRVFLTGATGFIGGAVASALIADGHSVRGLVRRTSQQLRLLFVGNAVPYCGWTLSPTDSGQLLEELKKYYEVVLIDEDSRVVLRRVWGEMSVRERIRLLTSALGAFFTRKEKVEAELQRFYRDEQSFLREFAAELPTAKRILIDERDAAMARTLRQLAESRGEVVAVVGEGHVDGLLHQLAGVPVDIVHLEQLRSAPAGPNASVNVSVHL